MEPLQKLLTSTNKELKEIIEIDRSNGTNSIDIMQSMDFIGGELKTTRRIFYKETNGMILSRMCFGIGWVLFCDVDKCMICANSFSHKLAKYQCHACGNVICSHCCEFDVMIEGNTSPNIACFQCYWEQAIVPLNTTTDIGLPVHFDDLSKFGEISIIEVESTLLIRGKSKDPLTNVCINICASNFIPKHARRGLICMLYGPSFLASDGVKVYTVVVNKEEFDSRFKKNNKNKMDLIELQTDGGVVELCTQALDLVSRASFDPLCSTFKIDPVLPFYNHKLSKSENQRYGNSLMTASTDNQVNLDSGLQIAPKVNKTHMITVAIPDEDCFRKYNQVPLTLKQAANYMKQKGISMNSSSSQSNHNLVLYRSGEASSPGRYPTSSLSFIDNGEISKTKGFNSEDPTERTSRLLRNKDHVIQDRMTLNIGAPRESEQSFSGLASSQSNLCIDVDLIEPNKYGLASHSQDQQHQEFKGKIKPNMVPISINKYHKNQLGSRSNSGSRTTRSSGQSSPAKGYNDYGILNENLMRPGLTRDEIGSSRSSNSIASATTTKVNSIRNKIQLRSIALEPDMFQCTERDRMNAQKAKLLINDSKMKPEVLIGMLILVTVDDRKVKGVVTDIRKNIFRRTEFKINDFEESSWHLLKRGSGKTGNAFYPLKRVFSIF